MAKASEAFRTISEVADELDVPKHVLRFWEGKFPQIRPMKRGGGRRYYRPEDVELLKGIQVLLHLEGFTIRGVQKILKEQGTEQVKASGESGSLVAGVMDAGGAPVRTKRADATRSRGRPAIARSHKLIQQAINEFEACRKLMRETV